MTDNEDNYIKMEFAVFVSLDTVETSGSAVIIGVILQVMTRVKACGLTDDIQMFNDVIMMMFVLYQVLKRPSSGMRQTQGTSNNTRLSVGTNQNISLIALQSYHALPR
jgi:hypothetical protein